MDTNEESLKTLKSIKTLLETAMAGAGNNVRGAGPATPDNAAVMRAVRDAATTLTTSFNTVNTSLGGLNQTIGHVNTSFGSLNTQIGRFINTLGGVQLPNPQLHQPTTGLNPVQQQVQGILGPLTNAARTLQNQARMPSAAQSAAQQLLDAARRFNGNIRNIRPEDIPILQQGPVFGRMVENFAKAATGGYFLTQGFQELRVVLTRVTNDYLSLARVGLGSWKNLGMMSINAMKAGMSLEDYRKTVMANNAFATRVGSIDEFDRITNAADAQLATLGVFGAESKALQASLANSNVMLGISTGSLIDTAKGQINAFEDLRKSTNLTGEEFGNLIGTLAKNENVQREMLGVAPAQRSVRFAEIAAISVANQKLLGTGAAADALTQAMIAARGDTVKGRYESAGRLRQAGAMVGMGAEGDRAAQIAMMGARASAADQAELQDILGRIDSSLQTSYQTGSLGQQNAIDVMSEALAATGQGKTMIANRPAVLAQQSGQAGSNRDFGQHVNAFGEAVGKLTSALAGFQASIGPAAMIAAGSFALAFARIPLLRFLGNALGANPILTNIRGNVLPNVAATAGQALPNIAGAGNRWAPARGGLSTVAQAVPAPGMIERMKNGFSSLSSLFQEVGSQTGNMVNAAKGFGSGLWNAAKMATRAFLPLAGIWAAGMELFTGDIAKALNPNATLFDRFGGIVTAFFTAIPNMFIDAFTFVFGEKAGGGLQNKFDAIVALVNGAFNTLFGKIFDSIGKMLTWALPEDSALAKTISSWGKSLNESADANFGVAKDLQNDSKKTLSGIAKANTEAAKKNTDSANKATDTAVAAQAKFNNTAVAGQVTAAGMIADARTLIGVPQVQVPPAIGTGTGTVNSDGTVTKLGEQDAAAGKVTAITQSHHEEIIAALSNMLIVLRDNLPEITRNTSMTTLTRPPVTFRDAEETQRLITRNAFI
jgi:hypothetical protein